MGNTCKPMAVSFQCMTKSTTNKKKKKNPKKKRYLAQKPRQVAVFYLFSPVYPPLQKRLWRAPQLLRTQPPPAPSRIRLLAPISGFCFSSRSCDLLVHDQHLPLLSSLP